MSTEKQSSADGLSLRGTVKLTFVFLKSMRKYVTVKSYFFVQNYSTQMIIILLTKKCLYLLRKFCFLHTKIGYLNQMMLFLRFQVTITLFQENPEKSVILMRKRKK